MLINATRNPVLEKCVKVVDGCFTPKQMTVSLKYSRLALKTGRITLSNYSVLLERINNRADNMTLAANALEGRR